MTNTNEQIICALQSIFTLQQQVEELVVSLRNLIHTESERDKNFISSLDQQTQHQLRSVMGQYNNVWNEW